jgi:hypothetical protein
LPLLNAKRIDLLDDQKLQMELVSLERRTSRAGKDSIDHMPNSHDDIANAVAGVAGLLAVGSGMLDCDSGWVGGPELGESPQLFSDLPYFYRTGGLPWLQ